MKTLSMILVKIDQQRQHVKETQVGLHVYNSAVPLFWNLVLLFALLVRVSRAIALTRASAVRRRPDVLVGETFKWINVNFVEGTGSSPPYHQTTFIRFSKFVFFWTLTKYVFASVSWGWKFQNATTPTVLTPMPWNVCATLLFRIFKHYEFIKCIEPKSNFATW